MGKSKQTIVNNIKEVNLDIDYDKLAEAIVAAQKKATPKKKSTNRFRGAVMSVINGMPYLIITLFSVFGIVGMWLEYVKSAEQSLLFCIGCTVVFVIVGLYALLCQLEALRDSDEDAQQHFNTNMALIALIISFIALVKG